MSPLRPSYTGDEPVGISPLPSPRRAHKDRPSPTSQHRTPVARSFAESKALGIGASPTWLANNKYKFSGIDAQTIKTNLCQHNAKMAGCDATLSGQQAPKPGAAKEPGCGN